MYRLIAVGVALGVLLAAPANAASEPVAAAVNRSNAPLSQAAAPGFAHADTRAPFTDLDVAMAAVVVLGLLSVGFAGARLLTVDAEPVALRKPASSLSATTKLAA